MHPSQQPQHDTEPPSTDPAPAVPASVMLEALARMDADDADALAALVALVSQLNSDERGAVLDRAVGQARRVVEGRDIYGSLRIDTDPRDFLEQAIEESDDLGFYLAVERRRRAVSHR